jgi:hypothetical protein
MICKTCNKIITNESTYCTYCGSLQKTKQRYSKKYDLTYENESEAVTLGIILIVISALLFFIGPLDKSDYSWFRAFTVIIRIIVTIWVVNIARRQNRNTFGWGLFSFLLPSIALIISGLSNKLWRDIEGENKESSNETKIADDPMIGLIKLKENGILSDSEYEKKIVEINLSKDQKENNRLNQIFAQKLRDRTKPLIELSLDAKNKGLLTEEEFERKVQEIITKYSHEIYFEDNNRPTTADIPFDIFNTLTPQKQNRVKTLLEAIRVGDRIVLGYDKIKLIDMVRWGKLVASGESYRYQIIIEFKIKAT